MAWTSPMTFVANSVLTAAQLNTNLRDNLNETAPAKATTAGSIFVATGSNAIAERVITSDLVSAAQTTTSTSYTDLATAGPSVEVTTSVRALVIIGAAASNNTSGQGFRMSIAVSGATTLNALDDYAFGGTSSSANDQLVGSKAWYFDSLTPGSNVFTAKYRVLSGGGTGNWQRRSMVVVPL